jgi:hypothetical protein
MVVADDEICINSGFKNNGSKLFNVFSMGPILRSLVTTAAL